MRKTLVVAAIAAAALGMTSAPAMAAGVDGTDRTSATTEGAFNKWNDGGAMVGRGAAQMVSSAYIGAPSYVLDLVGSITSGDLDPNKGN